jgi:hypothetical protein
MVAAITYPELSERCRKLEAENLQLRLLNQDIVAEGNRVVDAANKQFADGVAAGQGESMRRLTGWWQTVYNRLLQLPDHLTGGPNIDADSLTEVMVWLDKLIEHAEVGAAVAAGSNLVEFQAPLDRFAVLNKETGEVQEFRTDAETGQSYLGVTGELPVGDRIGHLVFHWETVGQSLARETDMPASVSLPGTRPAGDIFEKYGGDPRFLKILEEIAELHARKQRDYGTKGDPFANVRASEQLGIPAWLGAVLRANDKMKRIQAFAQNGNLANESLEDSLMDLATYMIIATVLYRERQFTADIPAAA